MAYIRTIVLVLAFEVLVTALVGIGIYTGFSVFPYSQTTPVTNLGAAAHTGGFHATIPLYMPTLSDLKVPYTQLQSGAPKWGIMAILVSAAVMVLQSFVRGMYLGGLKGLVQSGRTVHLIACGRRYFGGMLAWSVFQIVMGALTLFLGGAFVPLGLLLLLILLFYTLTPYLIVLQDLSFNEALVRAPRTLRVYFWSLLPLGLLAMVCTLLVSGMRFMTPPWGYAAPLLVYAVAGTWLIAELMRQLEAKLRADGEEAPHPSFDDIRTGRMTFSISVLFVPLLIAAGVYASMGKHLSAFDIGGKERFAGISYLTNFSDVFYVTKQQYTAYEWRTGEYSIHIRLPDLSGGKKPGELRGMAEITWQVDEEFRTANGNTTFINVQPFTRKSKLIYRLVRETAQDGSIYYSSLSGSASILPGEESPREPIAVHIMVSGNGDHVFILQYPTDLNNHLSQFFRVSNDGRYLIPGTSQLNPMDVHAYWFTKDHRLEEVFDLLASKNKTNFMPTLNRAYTVLAVAMQEGDGHMVAKILETMRGSGINVKAPDWDAQTWTDYLRSRYEGASMDQTLKHIAKAGVQGSYEGRELPEKRSGKTGVYRFEVTFPNGTLPILYEESKEDGKLLSVAVMD